MVSNSSKTHFTADMSAHEVARELDVDVESGDATVVGEPQLVSSDSIKEIVKCLDEINLEMANFNLKCKEDIWNNHEFFLFLEDYFQNSLRALDFCAALKDCLKRTRDNQLIVAINSFEEEVEDVLDGVEYVKTLRELRKFKDAEDPFTDEFFQLLGSVYEEHESMLEKLKPWKTKLDKELKHMKRWKKVSLLVVAFVLVLVSVLVSTVVLAAIKTPAWAKVLTGLLSSVPTGYLVHVCNSFFKSLLSALEGKRGVISSMRDGTRTTKKDLGNIKALIHKLRNETDSMLDTTDLALGEKEAVTVVIPEIQKRLEMLTNTAQNLRDNADRCRDNSVGWRKLVLRSMFRRERD
ncbi:hypothetical protein I3843_01G029200 [Carya illinoinensis]|nr:hypothetical protein I3843_01G029200 [Carya illinoinensis]